jgi:hypothetical protein
MTQPAVIFCHINLDINIEKFIKSNLQTLIKHGYLNYVYQVSGQSIISDKDVLIEGFSNIDDGVSYLTSLFNDTKSELSRVNLKNYNNQSEVINGILWPDLLFSFLKNIEYNIDLLKDIKSTSIEMTFANDEIAIQLANILKLQNEGKSVVAQIAIWYCENIKRAIPDINSIFLYSTMGTAENNRIYPGEISKNLPFGHAIEDIKDFDSLLTNDVIYSSPRNTTIVTGDVEGIYKALNADQEF